MPDLDENGFVSLDDDTNPQADAQAIDRCRLCDTNGDRPNGLDLTAEQISQRFAEIAGRVDTSPITCQCIIGCSGHPAGCWRPAEVTFEVHLLGQCNGPDANPDGNRVELMCMPCAARMWAGVSSMVAKMLMAAHRVGGRAPQCATCGAKVTTTTDVIRGQRRTVGGIR